MSTVNRRWAVFHFGLAPGYTYRTCNVPTGRIVARRVHGRWRESSIGSDFDCSDPGLPNVRVQRDLGVRCTTQHAAR